MLTISHLTAGTAIATKVKNPKKIVILALISHYFFDALPHTEVGVIIKQQPFRYNWETIVGIFDTILGIVLVLFLIKKFSLNRKLVFLSAFFASLPDIFYVIFSRYLCLDNTLFFQIINYPHDFSHFETPKSWWIVGILTQVLIIVISYVLIRKWSLDGQKS